MRKVIENINFLDLSSAAEESLEGVTKLQNINLMLFSKKVAKSLSSITMKNVNFSAEVPEKCTQVNGQFELDESFAASVKELLYLVINGTLVVKPDVTVEIIEKTLSGLFVNGGVYCPEKVKGIIQQKTERLNGNITAYMDDADVLAENVRFDNNYLRSLQPGTNIVVTGKVTMVEPLDSSLLQERLGKVEFLNRALIREDYMEIITEKMLNPHKCKMTWIPVGAVYVDKDFYLDSMAIQRFEHATLYVTGTIQLGSDVSQEILVKCIDKIYTNKTIICRKELKEAVLKRCDDPSVTVLDYTGKLLVVDGEHKLTQAELKYTKENLSLLVRGVLDIADNVDPEALYDKVDSIDNYGVINGDSEQCGVVQTKLRTNKGVVSDRKEPDDEQNAPEEEDAGEIRIANMNYLKL